MTRGLPSLPSPTSRALTGNYLLPTVSCSCCVTLNTGARDLLCWSRRLALLDFPIGRRRSWASNVHNAKKVVLIRTSMSGGGIYTSPDCAFCSAILPLALYSYAVPVIVQATMSSSICPFVLEQTEESVGAWPLFRIRVGTTRLFSVSLDTHSSIMYAPTTVNYTFR